MEKPGVVVLYESALGRCSAEFSPAGKVYLHLRVRQWGMEAMRELRAQWPSVKAHLASLGYTRIYAYNYARDADKKWERFMALLGFKETGRGNGLIVMGVDNA